MPVLYRASFGYLMRHPWQLALALTGICVGVAVVVAVDLANDSSRRAFLMSMDAVNGEATHQVVAGPAGIDESLYVSLRVDAGMRNIAPIVEGYVDTGNRTLRLLGVDAFAERNFRAYVLRDSGEYDVTGGEGGNDLADVQSESPSPENFLRRLLTEPGAVMLSGRAADALGVSVGSVFIVRAGGREFDARVVALTAPDDERGSENLLITDIATAQQWLDKAGMLSRIDVRIEARAGSDEFEAQSSRIRALLPDEALLLPAASRSESVGEMSEAFMTNLTAMSLLALLIGVFLIYNSVSFAVLQRRPLFGVLRALGLTRGGAFRLILLEALILGAVGTGLGLALGFALGRQLLVLVSQSINDLYYVVHVTDVAMTPASLVRGAAAGLGATLLAAAVPALEAASCRPRLALARSRLEIRSGRLASRVAAIGLFIAVAGLALIPLSGTRLVGGLVAVFMLVFGLALCVPVAVRNISRFLVPAGSRLGSVGLKLAVAGTGGSLSRSGVAIVALAVAVSATIGVTVMVDSFRGSVSAWLDNTLRSDLYVGVGDGTLDTGLAEQLQRLPGIADRSITRRVWLETEAGRTRLTAIDMAAEAYAGVDLEGGDSAEIWRQFEQPGSVLVSASYAFRHGVQRGDLLTLRTPSGDRQFRIAGVYRSYDADLDAVLMNRDNYVALWKDEAIGSLGLYLAEGADPVAVTREIRRLSEGRQALLIGSNRDLRERSMQIFDRTFIITDVLYWLAFCVAAVGILGAMLALQLERARELAIYRALGMTPGQLGRMVVAQSAFMGILSGLAAVPLGLVMAVVLVRVINRRAFGWQMEISVSAEVVATALLLAALTATVAGMYPAWRASRASPALAMREE